jgi:predicted MFS family arabinose efflux permease
VIGNYLDVLRDPWVRTILLTVFLEGALFFGAFAYVGVFLKSRFSLSYAATGALLACYGIGAFLYSVLVRRLLALMNEVGFIRTGGGVLIASFGLLSVVPFWPAAIPVIMSAGFGFYMFHNTLQTKATEMAPKARGTGIAVFAFCLFLGQAAGVFLLGRLIRAAGYASAFTVSGILLFVLARMFARRLGGRIPK